MKILIDNGHGTDTPGKRSPDGTYREGIWARGMAQRLRQLLISEYGFRHEDVVLLVPEQADISLKERVRRANKYGRDALLVSLHSNASGSGQWMKARGWSIYTTRGITGADRLATFIYQAAIRRLSKYKVTFRHDFTDGDPDIESNFYILARTLMPAALSENFFHDNREDLNLLRTEAVQDALARAHADGIRDFIAYTQQLAGK